MSDREDVAAADDRFFDALNALFSGDSTPMEALWSHAEDVVYMGPAPKLFDIGWKSTDRDWGVQGAAHLAGSIRRTIQHVTMGRELAVVHHIAEVTGQPSGRPEPVIEMRGTNVFRKEDGTWKLIAHHSDPLPYLRA